MLGHCSPKMGSKMNSQEYKPKDVIEAFGGTTEVAKLCEITRSAVHQWRTNGIPKSQLMYLKAMRPKVFKALAVKKSELDASPPQAQPSSVQSPQ